MEDFPPRPLSEADISTAIFAPSGSDNNSLLGISKRDEPPRKNQASEDLRRRPLILPKHPSWRRIWDLDQMAQNQSNARAISAI
jgi:hypothetical protein